MKRVRFIQGRSCFNSWVGGDLHNTCDDAQLIESILTDPRRCAYNPENVTLLIDSKATKQNILKQLENLSNSVSKNDTVIIYFSGHGEKGLQEKEGEYFLIPYDFDIKDIADTSISDKEFAIRVKEIPSRKILILLDCCHAGGFSNIDTYSENFIKSSIPPKLVELFDQEKGFTLIASSKEDESSILGQYSYFTLALADGLCGGEVIKNDGYIRVSDIAMHTRDLVVALSDRKQHPVLYYQQASSYKIARNPKSEVGPEDVVVKIKTIIEKILYQNKLDEDYQKVDIINRSVIKQFLRIRQFQKQGKGDKVINEIQELKNSSRWEYIQPELKAELIIAEASSLLEITKKVEDVIPLLNSAYKFDNKCNQSKIRSYIALLQGNVKEAIRLIEHEYDIDGVNFRASIHLSENSTNKVQELLSENNINKLGISWNAESYRLKALACIMEGNVSDAQIESQKAWELSPEWVMVRFARGVVDYFSCLSPIVGEPNSFYWPVPFPEELVMTDQNSMYYLNRALEMFNDLSTDKDIQQGKKAPVFNLVHGLSFCSPRKKR